MSIKYPKGSEWRKWDLHFHTPSSYDYNNLGVKDEEIIQTLINHEIKVVAITDHHKIDLERINNLKRLAGDKLTILPGIEFRSELGGSESIHYIAIFSENCDIESIWIKIQGTCNLTDSDRNDIGEDRLRCNLEDTCKVIHDLGGIVSIHAGSKTNTLECITNSLSHKMAQKTDIAKKSVDIYELGKPEDQKGYREKVFPKIEKVLPMIICSDNHNIKQYNLKENCWVKADPTFEGLKQIINEPEERVFIGEKPPKLKLIDKNKSRFIRSVEIKKDEDKSLSDKWFDNKLVFNPDLVAIIGNKGSGKSALTDIISLLGFSKKIDDFSFLNKTKFKKKSDNLANYFSATIEWYDGSKNAKTLSYETEPNKVERIKYLPQRFTEKICNELDTDFDKELNNVIFSYLPEEEKYNYHKFDELVKYLTTGINENISTLKNKLNNFNSEIVDLEEKLQDDYKKTIENQLNQKKQDLQNLEKNPPAKVDKPNKEKSNTIEEKIQRLDKKIGKIESEIKQKQNKLTSITKHIKELEKIEKKIEDFKNNYKELKAEISNTLDSIDPQLDIKMKFEIDTVIIKKKIAELTEKKAKLNAEIKKPPFLQEDNDSLFKRKEDLVKEKDELKNELSNQDKKYQDYLEAKKKWEEDKREIVGEKDKDDTIKFYEAKLQDIEEQLPKDLREKLKKRLKISSQIYDLKRQKVEIYEEIYKHVMQHIEKNDKIYENIKFSVEVTHNEKFIENILSYIDGRSFKDTEEIKNLIAKHDLNKKYGKSSLIKFLLEISKLLTQDKNKTNKYLKGDPLSFYNFFFALDYLKVSYKLKYNNKNMDELSPGEKGTLLLIFYLLLDRDNIPLIIDQPEDNLDNQFIYTKLVDCIKNVKQERQIFIVTHNPNIAVACDAEQIIYCHIDKKNGNKVTYESGSIEEPIMKAHIIDILEGTEPAFVKRKLKYNI